MMNPKIASKIDESKVIEIFSVVNFFFLLYLIKIKAKIDPWTLEFAGSI